MVAGIDVAKAELVVSVLPSTERFTVTNDARGVRTLRRFSGVSFASSGLVVAVAHLRLCWPVLNAHRGVVPDAGPPSVACCCIAAIPIIPPSPISCTALLGTIISAPFCLIPSKRMFIARSCSAVGFF